MPEPRETHAAIDARRNAQRGGGEREALARLLEQHPAYSTGNDQQDWFKALEAADAILAAGWEHPDDEVLVEGSWFARPDLPVILGNFMRRCDEYGREAKALAATVQRVRDLHHKGSMYFVAGECANEECDHEDVCPEEPRDVCSECWERAEEISPYFAEQHCPDWVMWPCDTIRALAPSDPATDTSAVQTRTPSEERP